MPCLACGTRALRSFLTSTEAVRSSDVCARNVRCSIAEASKCTLHVTSLALWKRPASSIKISTFPRSQALGCHTALFTIGTRGLREEPSHRIKNVSTIAVNQKSTISGNLLITLGSRRHLVKRERGLKADCWRKNGASVDQDLSIENMKGFGRRSYATYLLGDDSMRVEDLGIPKLAGLGRRTPLRDYSAGTSEESKGGMISVRPGNVSADSKNRREPWQIQKEALADKFGPTGWLPRKRLSPDTLEGIRALHTQYPDRFTTPILADQFKVSPEAIRRILKSKWRPNDEEQERRRRRWEKRGENIWSQMAEMGIKPPKKWRIMGLGKSTQRHSARSIQLESQIKSKSSTTSLPGLPVTDSYTTTATGDKTHSPLLLADRIL